MSVIFNADEIFEMAEQIERNGAKFYRKAADAAVSVRARPLLLRLASMEDDHERTFAAMRTSLSPQQRAAMVFDPDDQAVLYLRVIAGGYVFDVKGDPSKRLTGRETMGEILRTAIVLEKDSIVFYVGIKEKVPERLGKDKVDAVIREEMSHVTLLSNELAGLKES
jgi:rubrerythrin